MISQETLDRIKQGINLPELVSETVQLKRTGSSYVGLCPFHSEKSGSFNVRENTNFYHCFGCGASGNAISFVMEIRGLPFPEAVEFLADRLGIEVKRTDGRDRGGPAKEDTKTLYRLTEAAQDYFVAGLKAPEAVQYLEKRGLSAETIEKFGLGFAPQQWRELVPHLERVTKDGSAIAQSGLVRRSPKGDLYDTFRGRLMFPIFIDRTKIAGFGGRVLPQYERGNDGASAPKYMNSPESPIYHKSKIFYGIPQALESIRQQKSIYLVEGYMDVVSLAQAGVPNVLATCGTSVTDEHVRRLRQLATRVRVLFDGDAAGRAAAGKSFLLFQNAGLDVHALFLPDGMDPDDVAREHGSAAQAFLEGLPATPLIDCYVQLLIGRFGVATIEDLGAAGKGKLAEELARVLQRVENEIERDELRKRAAYLLRVDAGTLRDLTPDTKPTQEMTTALVESGEHQYALVSALPRVDRELLLAVMGTREQYVDQILSRGEISSMLHASTLVFVEEFKLVISAPAGDDEKKERLRELLQRFGDSWLQLWKQSFSMASDKAVRLDKLFEECVRHLRRESLSRTVEELRSQLARCEDQGLKEQLSQQLFSLVQRRDELNQGVRTV